MELYDIHTNPTKYVELYWTLMEMQGASQVILCHAFPLSLVGAAQRCFKG